MTVEQCELPFEVGSCDAAFPVFWHNPATGQCEPETWGGCDGNDNRFTMVEECTATCGGAPSGQNCEVDGVVSPDGATAVPEPAGCNTCACVDGAVTNCTKIGCPSECEEGSALGTECADCGPTDACLTVRSGCLPICETQEDCSEAGGGPCIEGLCRSVCG
jgi:hypothetical protein